MRSISVVLGTYNGERYIAEQLDSIFAQTLRPLEILVSDDGSTDRTLEVVEQYRDREIPIRVHRNTSTLGFGDNFLSAVERAVGDLIAFADQDDIWYPNKLATQAAVLAKTGASASTHDTDYIDQHGRPLPRSGSRTGRRLRVLREWQMEPWGNFLGNTLLIRRRLLIAVPRGDRGAGPVDGEHLISHDRWAFALASMADGIALVPQRLSAYRQHSQQLFGLAPVGTSSVGRDAIRKLIGREERLADLAEFRIALIERGAPAANPGRSLRRWRAVKAQHLRAVRLYQTAELTRAIKLLRLAQRFGGRDYFFTRFGGLGPRRLVDDIRVVLR